MWSTCILIGDDEPINRLLLHEYWNDAGYDADEADGGLEAGDQEPDGLGEELHLAQAIAFLLGQDQLAQDIVAGRLAPLRDELCEVLAEMRSALQRLGLPKNGSLKAAKIF